MSPSCVGLNTRLGALKGVGVGGTLMLWLPEVSRAKKLSLSSSQSFDCTALKQEKEDIRTRGKKKLSLCLSMKCNESAQQKL